MQNYGGSYDDTWIQYYEFLSVCCNFIFHVTHISNKIVTMFYTFYFSVAKFYCPVPTSASHEWSAPRQIFLRGQGHSGVIFILLYMSLYCGENTGQYTTCTVDQLCPNSTLFLLCTYNVHVNQYCTVVQCTVNEESMCFPTGWWQLGYKLRMYSWKLCLKSFLLIKNTW